jgi:hypothetical protein
LERFRLPPFDVEVLVGRPVVDPAGWLIPKNEKNQKRRVSPSSLGVVSAGQTASGEPAAPQIQVVFNCSGSPSTATV